MHEEITQFITIQKKYFSFTRVLFLNLKSLSSFNPCEKCQLFIKINAAIKKKKQ